MAQRIRKGQPPNPKAIDRISVLGRMAAPEEIAKVADDNAASTEQVSAATEEQLAAMQDMALATRELAQLAEELMAVVERFRVDSADEVPE